jgi:hypothetical protein
MATMQVYEVIEYAEFQDKEELQGWWWPIADDGSVYIPIAYPYGFADGLGIIPERELAIANVSVYRGPGSLDASREFQGDLVLGFDVKNVLLRKTPYKVYVAQLKP